VKKALRCDRRRELVQQVEMAHGVSEPRGCATLGVDRSTIRYRSIKPDQAPLRLRIRDLAKTRVGYGYFRIYILLRREGWVVNHKRVYRLYREEGLSLRLRRRAGTSAPPTGSGSQPRRRRTLSGRWILSPMRYATADAFTR
jgi:transposase InsO family protein